MKLKYFSMKLKYFSIKYKSKIRPSHDDRRRHLRRRCEDHDKSLRSDRLMMTGRDTSGEGVRAMKGAQPQSRCDDWI